MKALISLYDKTGAADFARALRNNGFDLVSTGGTYKFLKMDAGLPVTQVSDLTGFPEMLGGRVKTLHPKIHAGILARRHLADDLAELAVHKIDTIDMVAVNLYPFVETVEHSGAVLEDALENIDIGGPTLIRAAAKNFPHVVVVVDPADYAWIAQRLSEGSDLSVILTDGERKALAQKAFQHVAFYDTAISRYLGDGNALSSDDLTLGYDKLNDLRYGENPHQKASVYSGVLSSGGIANAKQHHGAELSYNNILDADAAWCTISDFEHPAVTVVKHTNPCGLAMHSDQPTAYKRAYEGDSVSAYGGIVGFNRRVTVNTAEVMRGVLYDIIVAPDYEPMALEVLKKRKNTRILEVARSEGSLQDLELRTISGGALLQTLDTLDETPESWEIVTKRKPTKIQMNDLVFAWRVSKHIKSNTIVLAKDVAVVGMGAGQPNRVTSIHLALRIAGDKAVGSALASDAFMPFADNVEMASKGGITAIVQPGGSIRDNEVIEAADRLDISMLFTGVRHFKH